MTVSPTLLIGQNASGFAEPQVIAEPGSFIFMMTFAFFAVTREALHQIVRTITALLSLIFPPVMWILLETLALETCLLMLCCGLVFNKVE